MTSIVRRVALTLNILLIVYAIWGAIILPQQLLRWPELVRELIQTISAGTAVIAIAWPNGWTRR